MRYKSIAIAGLPKAGKTALIEMLQKELGWEVLHIGGIFRKKYEEWKSKSHSNYLTFEEFYARVITEKDIIDANIEAKKRLEKGNVILDSRFPRVNCEGLNSVLSVFVTAPLEIRAMRAIGGNGYSKNLEEVKNALEFRENKEAEWGQQTYGALFGGKFDYRDIEQYSLVIDSSKMTIKEEVKFILTELNKGKVIAISGLPGAGSTTAGKIIANKLNLNYFSPGQLFKDISTGRVSQQHYYSLFRELCNRNNLKIPEFKSQNDSLGVQNLWNTDFGKSKEFHNIIDELQIALANKGGIVIDGKLSLHMINWADLRVWLIASINKRMTRTSNRDNLPDANVSEIILSRENSEAEGWKNIYGFDYRKQESLADLIIDTSDFTPEEIAEKILSFYKKFKK